MKNYIIGLLLVFAAVSFVEAQGQQNLEEQKAPANLENIFPQKLFGDSLVTSTMLFIKKEVKLHRHDLHSEHVYVMEGEAEMILGAKKITIKKGDLVFIPRATPHSVKVTSTVPLKCISVQAPMFDGKDRILLE